MPRIRPISAVQYPVSDGPDVSTRIAPPYDVLDETSKAALLQQSPANIVAIDLPHLPAKTVGPDATYDAAGKLYRQWIADGVLTRRTTPAVFVYQQTYTVGDDTFRRRGLMANVAVQPFGLAPEIEGAPSAGGIFPHEQTFSGPKEDRLKLMRATQAQLSPIFGLYSDADGAIGNVLTDVVASRKPDMVGRTANDNVLHELWTIDSAADVKAWEDLLRSADVFIADGHHRYNTALNRLNELEAGGNVAADDPSRHCLFCLVAMQDPGMIVLPTHRVLGGMAGLTREAFTKAAAGKLDIKPFAGTDLTALEAALPAAGPHAMGLCFAGEDQPLAIATTVDGDPLKATHPDASEAWRQLDVAVLQHLIVEGICQPTFAGGGEVLWKFPHGLDEFETIVNTDGFQLGVVLQATPLASVQAVSEAGELMPQKSTFFYPKVATGLVINPLD